MSARCGGRATGLSWPDAINRPSAIPGCSRTHAHPWGASTHTGRDPYARSTGPRHATLRNTDGLAVHHRICGSGGDRHQAGDGSYDGASRHGVLLTTSGLGSPSSSATPARRTPPANAWAWCSTALASAGGPSGEGSRGDGACHPPAHLKPEAGALGAGAGADRVAAVGAAPPTVAEGGMTRAQRATDRHRPCFGGEHVQSGKAAARSKRPSRRKGDPAKA